MEGYHQSLTGGEAPQIDAVVILVAAAVLLVFHGELVALFGVHLQALPVLFTALAVDENRAAQLDGALVVPGLGGDLVRKGQVAVLRKGQGQGAGRIALSGAAGKQDLLAVLGANLPGRGAGAGISGDGEPVEIVVNGLRGRKNRHGDQAHQHDHRQHHGEQSLFHVAFFLSLILSLSPAREPFHRRRRISNGTDAISGSAPAHRCRPTYISKRLGRMSQCRQASDPAVSVSGLSGSAGFTVTHSQGFAPYSACPAARGRPLDLLFSFRRGLSPFRMFQHSSVYHRNLPLAREISPVPPPFQPPPSAFLTRSLHAPPHLPPYSLHLPSCLPLSLLRFSPAPTV